MVRGAGDVRFEMRDRTLGSIQIDTVERRQVASSLRSIGFGEVVESRFEDFRALGRASHEVEQTIELAEDLSLVVREGERLAIRLDRATWCMKIALEEPCALKVERLATRPVVASKDLLIECAQSGFEATRASMDLGESRQHLGILGLLLAQAREPGQRRVGTDLLPGQAGRFFEDLELAFAVGLRGLDEEAVEHGRPSFQHLQLPTERLACGFALAIEGECLSESRARLVRGPAARSAKRRPRRSRTRLRSSSRSGRRQPPS